MTGLGDVRQGRLLRCKKGAFWSLAQEIKGDVHTVDNIREAGCFEGWRMRAGDRCCVLVFGAIDDHEGKFAIAIQGFEIVFEKFDNDCWM